MPELHLLIGAVDKIAGFLLTDWDGFELWLKEHYIIKRGYGVGWDGNNANKILELIDKLQLEVQLKVSNLLEEILILTQNKIYLCLEMLFYVYKKQLLHSERH